MHKYLVTSSMTALPWLHLVLKFFFVNIPKIADRGLVPSVSGNNYLLILFYIDRNSIFSKLILNRTKHSIKNSYANILKILKNRGLKPQFHILKNEASDIIKIL